MLTTRCGVAGPKRVGEVALCRESTLENPGELLRPLMSLAVLRFVPRSASSLACWGFFHPERAEALMRFMHEERGRGRKGVEACVLV